jgi:predicted Zn-dependent protease
LAHVTCRHHLRGIINNIGIFAILSASIGDISALAGTFANMGGELASLSNSRSFENEADEVGWQYLVKAKINPKGMISFFETLEKEQQSTLDSTIKETVDLSILSTHPDTKERIKHLRKMERERIESFPSLPNTFEAFKAAMRKRE